MPIMFNTLPLAAKFNLGNIRLLSHKHNLAAKGSTLYELANIKWQLDLFCRNAISPKFFVSQSKIGDNIMPHQKNKHSRQDRETRITETLGPILAHEGYLRFSYELPCDLIAVPFDQISCIKPDDANLYSSQARPRYPVESHPYALIMNEHKVDGWISWFPPGQVKLYNAKHLRKMPSKDAPLNDVMRSLKGGAILLMGETKPNDDGIDGVIFPKYLNHPVVRSFFYQWVLSLEQNMIEVIKLVYHQDSWVKERFLGDISEIEDKKNKLRRRGRIVGLTECLSLPETLRVLNGWKGNKDSERILWYTKSEARIGDLISFRNIIMHPITELITDDDPSVGALVGSYELLKNLTIEIVTIKQVLSLGK